MLTLLSYCYLLMAQMALQACGFPVHEVQKMVKDSYVFFKTGLDYFSEK